jgi:hypothetical protein
VSLRDIECLPSRRKTPDALYLELHECQAARVSNWYTPTRPTLSLDFRLDRGGSESCDRGQDRS